MRRLVRPALDSSGVPSLQRACRLVESIRHGWSPGIELFVEVLSKSADEVRATRGSEE